MYRRCIATALLAALIAPVRLLAQHPDSLPPAGTIRGTVVDAATSLPLIGATVTLAPSGGSGAFPPVTGESTVSATRTTVTRTHGDYAFADLSSGRYRLYVQRLGYAPTALDVELRGVATARVSVGLDVLPVRLQAVQVDAASSDPITTPRIAGADAEGSARVAAARERQRAFLGTDVRELTTSDVAEAATFGEADLFRALRRLPGVVSYDDWSSELWIRGATWNQTQVLFDGLPLVQPTHAQGTLAGVGADAISAAFLYPGVRSASVPGDGAALVDLRSRPGGGTGRVRGSTELSRVGAHLALDQRDAAGRYDWSISARRSFEDVDWAAARWLADGLSGYEGVHYTEVAGRADVNLGGGRALETSALFTNDYETGLPPNDEDRSVKGGGNAVVKATLRVPVSGLITTYSYGVSRYRFEDIWEPLKWMAWQADGAAFPASPTLPVHNGHKTVDYVTLGGDVRPAMPDHSAPWSLGYAWTSRRANLHIPTYLLMAGSLSDAPRDESGELSYATVFGDRRWRYGPHVELEAGVRVDAGGSVPNAPAVRPAPSLQARYSASGSTLLSAGAGRSYQYTQSIANVLSINGDAGFGIPLLAGPTVPAVVADQINVGAEHWSGNGILATANVYARRLGGVAERNLPTPLAPAPDLLSITTVRAYGAELGARKLTGLLTGMINYSLSRATGDDGRQRYNASGERRHTVNVTAMMRHAGMHFGAALTAASGPPFTRINQGMLMSDSAGTLTWSIPPAADGRNAQHAPAFASLDLLTDGTLTILGIHATAFAQVQNALDRDNVSEYVQGISCSQLSSLAPDKCLGQDVLYNRVGRHLGFGLRITF